MYRGYFIAADRPRREENKKGTFDMSNYKNRLRDLTGNPETAWKLMNPNEKDRVIEALVEHLWHALQQRAANTTGQSRPEPAEYDILDSSILEESHT